MKFSCFQNRSRSRHLCSRQTLQQQKQSVLKTRCQSAYSRWCIRYQINYNIVFVNIALKYDIRGNTWRNTHFYFFTFHFSSPSSPNCLYLQGISRTVLNCSTVWQKLNWWMTTYHQFNIFNSDCVVKIMELFSRHTVQSASALQGQRFMMHYLGFHCIKISKECVFISHFWF